MLPNSNEFYEYHESVSLRPEGLETIDPSEFDRYAIQKIIYLKMVNNLITEWKQQKRPNLLCDSFLKKLEPTIVHSSLAFNCLIGSSVAKADFNDMPADYYYDQSAQLFRPTSAITLPGICMKYLQTPIGNPLPFFKK